MDEFATSIDGTTCVLAHPSKTDIRNKAATGKNANPAAFIGGCAAMYDAPRWVEILDTVKGGDDGPFRVLINEKPNYSKRCGVKLVEDRNGVVQKDSDVDPDNPCGKSDNSRGRKPKHDRTFLALEELFHTHRVAIHIDELLKECIRRGIFDDCAPDSSAWRGRRRTIREHLEHFTKKVEERETDIFALKP
jgi:hypothetical protein